MATITVRGHGRSAAQPDEVGVGLTVEAVRPKAAEAFAEASRLALEAVALCDELGVPAGRRTTSQISLAEHGEHTAAGWQHRGYRAASRIGVRLDDAELASRLVSVAAERLEARIDGPAWRVAHDNPAHADARRLAAADARAKAEEYAAALGVRVGAVASAMEPGTAPPGPPQPRAYAVHMDVSGMPLDAGEHEIVAEIDVTFRLEQG
jgi:uncharacterized protein YggE